ncbi:MAG TPA: heparan-alpha-glucosaminide N-acetyltransferase domain-containing protein [Nocardioides sp.]|nr:heparan-alpha-glucosaminide N-acetyltransferase domain-containing protein [Nocardioides sp.]
MDHHQQRFGRPRGEDRPLSTLARGSVVPAGRVVGLDVARCVALLGMIGTHTLSSDAPGGSALVHEVAGGRSSALFALLAGVSMALMSGRTRPEHGGTATRTEARLFLRALLVALIGLLLGELDTNVAVILTYYGLLFCLGIPFLRLTWKPLAALAAVWLIVGPVLSHLVRPALPAPSYVSPSFAAVDDPWQLLTELLFTGYYPAVPWLAYLLAGMAVGRLTLSSVKVAAVLAIGGQVVALVAKVASALLVDSGDVRGTLIRTYVGPGDPELAEILNEGLFGTTPTASWWWLAVSGPHTGTPFDLAHTIGTGLSVIGIALLFSAVAPKVFAVVFGAGAMTLTLYSLHVVLLVPQAWSEDSMGSFLKHSALILVIGAVYRLLGRSGPLERALALVTKVVVPDRRPVASSR